MAPEPSVCAEPANSERMSTPRLRCWQATYSKAFAFIPSRSDVIIITSARKQSAATSQGEMGWSR